jgi:hypothetical protein
MICTLVCCLSCVSHYGLSTLHTPFKSEHEEPCVAAVYLRGSAAVAGGPLPVHQPSQLPAGSIQPRQGLPLPVDRQFQVQGPRSVRALIDFFTLCATCGKVYGSDKNQNSVGVRGLRT